jgi:hypothetical protein
LPLPPTILTVSSNLRPAPCLLSFSPTRTLLFRFLSSLPSLSRGLCLSIPPSGPGVQSASSGEGGEARVRGCDAKSHIRVRSVQVPENGRHAGYHAKLRKYAGQTTLYPVLSCVILLSVLTSISFLLPSVYFLSKYSDPFRCNVQHSNSILLCSALLLSSLFRSDSTRARRRPGPDSSPP